MDEEVISNKNSDSSCLLIIVAIFICGAVFGFGGILSFFGLQNDNPNKIMEYSGTRLMKVCKRPYYSDSDCYFLRVSSNGEEFTAINFPNGGYLDSYGTECFKDAGIYGNEGDNRFFCNFYDEDGNVWDISLPSSNSDT